MPVVEELKKYSPAHETALTIGVFDGVHLGHRHLIQRLKVLAEERNLIPGVVTFRCHPRLVLSPGARLPFLSSIEERIQLIKELGIDLVVPISFTLELSELTAREFVSLLKEYLKMGGLVVGPDFALGRGREGDIEVLRSLGEEMQFFVEVVPPLEVDGIVVSSTAIRNKLASGDMSSANRFLGRPFAVSGPVISGVERGRALGFPTANIKVDPIRALPSNGVYATWAYIGHDKHKSVTNIGKRPTFGGGERSVEVFLLNFGGDIYGQNLSIELVDRLREEKRFGSAEELKGQIAQDVERARSILKRD